MHKFVGVLDKYGNTGSKGNIDRSKCALAATDAMRAARNSCSKGNIDHSNSALAATDKIYVYILRSKCGKTQVMVSIKRVRFVILTHCIHKLISCLPLL